MKFYGSAMPFPHIQGAFREILIAEDYQCVPADGLSSEEAARNLQSVFMLLNKQEKFLDKSFNYWIRPYRNITSQLPEELEQKK